MNRVVKAAEVRIVESRAVGPRPAAAVAPEPVPPPAPPVGDLVADQIAQAEARAAQILAEAQAQAEAILEEAKKTALQTELDAYESGKAEGYQAGYEAGLASLDRLADLVDHAAIEWEDAIRSAERQLVELALAIAGRIVHRLSQEDEAMVLTAVMQALDHLAASPTVKVRVNPDDYELVTRHWAETRGPRYRDREWTFLADKNVAAGGCVLELEGGRIDAQLETQLQEVRRALLAAGGFDERTD
jgi:flagellar assembly protein FliH